MPKRLVKIPTTTRQPWLDIVSYGRRGHQHPNRFTAAQLQHIALIVRGAPEVMVKVSGGGRSAGAVAAHVKYIGRHGKLEIETDDGERLQGRGIAAGLIANWDLDIQARQFGNQAGEASARSSPRLVHNIVLSMPAKTNPEKLLAGARGFARETFALKYRYAMALHTDTDHPHVHLVVKAVSEQGQRLYIRKATLQTWREDFAKQLRLQGIAAAATPSRLRGRRPERMRDGAFWARRRGSRPDAAAPHQGSIADPKNAPSRERIGRRWSDIRADWELTEKQLRAQGELKLADDVFSFLAAIGSPTSAPVRPNSERNRTR